MERHEDFLYGTVELASFFAERKREDKLNKTSSKVYIRLSENLFRCKKYDLNFQITKTLIERIQEFPDIYIEEIAYAAKTTPASITKFCKKIGYQSFKEMRTDLDVYSNELMMDQFEGNKNKEDFLENVLNKEYQINQLIFETLDADQTRRIAKSIKEKSKIAIFGNNYSFTGVNFFRELLSQEGYLVMELNRSAERQLIESVLQECDAVFIISLTGDWVLENKELFINQSMPNYLLTQRKAEDFGNLFDEIITFDTFDFLLLSNYYSQKIIHLWTIYFVMFLKN